MICDFLNPNLNEEMFDRRKEPSCVLCHIYRKKYNKSYAKQKIKLKKKTKKSHE